MVCGFSAGGHLCASLCVHGADIEDPDEKYQKFSNKPDAAVLSYPVIALQENMLPQKFFCSSFREEFNKEELEYMSIEKYVTKEIPLFIWQTATDGTVPVQNSYLLAQKCLEEGVSFAHHVFSEGVHGMSVATRGLAGTQEDSLIHRSNFVCLQKRFLREKLHFQRKREEELLIAKWDWKNTATEMDSRAERRNPKDSERSTDLGPNWQRNGWRK